MSSIKKCPQCGGDCETILTGMKRCLSKKPKRKTITFRQFKRLTFCNSKFLPQTVELLGRRKSWTGISWIDVGMADGTEVLVVE